MKTTESTEKNGKHSRNTPLLLISVSSVAVMSRPNHSAIDCVFRVTGGFYVTLI
ncbi:hypothetical protein [Methanosarcina barkeri]|uniref:hypothetical protein n=1 Tax=Methanosarcina barkeri TaxID=2208 RepID=UPI0018B07FA4|nr:hypothetical protein [Methanosarcina barkeri]